MSETAARLLVVDADADLRQTLRAVLARDYEIVEAADGLEALRLFHQVQPDLVLLDTALPRLDGFGLLRRIRDTSDTPVIMMSMRADPEDAILGLRAGADDYVTKPFSIELLDARVMAMLRRTERVRRQPSRIELDDGRLVVDVLRAEVWVRGQRVDLSATEFRLLAFLARRPDRVVRPSEILAQVWGEEYAEETGYVKSFVRLVRRKIEQNPSAPRYLVSRRGLGYTLRSRPSDGPVPADPPRSAGSAGEDRTAGARPPSGR